MRDAFAKGIKVIWQVMIAVAGLGLLSSLLMKALPLHTQLDESWGIEEERERQRRGEEEIRMVTSQRQDAA